MLGFFKKNRSKSELIKPMNPILLTAYEVILENGTESLDDVIERAGDAWLQTRNDTESALSSIRPGTIIERVIEGEFTNIQETSVKMVRTIMDAGQDDPENTIQAFGYMTGQGLIGHFIFSRAVPIGVQGEISQIFSTLSFVDGLVGRLNGDQKMNSDFKKGITISFKVYRGMVQGALDRS
jgi:hypothetical protein